MCKEAESEHKSLRNEGLQNISTDDLMDSASQTAQPQDSKFSFRSPKHAYTYSQAHKYLDIDTGIVMLAVRHSRLEFKLNMSSKCRL